MGDGSQPLDCAIAGAGPTGLTLALELARRGKSVRLFDRSPGPRDERQSRALGVLPPSLKLLSPSGVTPLLIAEGLKIERAEIAQDGEPRFSIDITRAGGDYPFLLSLPQGHTERILMEKLAEHGVRPEWNSEVTGVETDEASARLVVDRGSKTETVAASFVAGCDGVHSIVREKIGVAFDGDRFPAVFSLADVTLSPSNPPGVAIADVSRNGFTARLPLPDGQVRLIGSFPDVEKHPSFAGLVQECGWVSEFTIAFRHAARLQKGPVFLAGDAAHVHSPAGGRGMNTGIGDAAWLAWLISQGREAEYESHRLPVAKMILSQTRQLTKIVAGGGRMVHFMVGRVLPRLTKFDAVQKRVARQLLAWDMPEPEWIAG